MQCKAVYRKLDASGVEYDVVDLSADENAEQLAAFIAAGHTQAPVVVAEGVETFTGFHPGMLAEVVVRHGLGEQ